MNLLSQKFSFQPQSNTETAVTAALPVQRIAHHGIAQDSRRAYWLIFFAIVLALLAPIWMTRYLPLADYPQALGRGYVAAHYTEVPLFQKLYEPPLNVATNRAFEAVAFVFGRVIPLDLLGRLFISAVILLFAIGCYAIPRLFHGRPMWRTMPMMFFIYSTHLVYGSINFLLGLALFFLVFAAWRSLVVRSPVRAAILLLLASPVLFLIHMAAYAFEWPAIGIALLFALQKKRISLWQAAGQLAPLLITLTLFQLFLAHGGTVSTIAFNTPYTKVMETLTLISTYRHSFDAIFALALAIILIYAFVRGTRWHLVPEAAVIGAAFYGLLLLFPGTFLAASGADVRFLIPSFVFVVASIDGTMSVRSFRIAFASILLLFVVRLASIALDWHRMSDWLAPQIALFQRVPEGGSIYPMYYDDSVSTMLERRLFPAFGVYAALEHHADYPGLLTIRKQESRDGGHYFRALSNPPAPDSLRAILDSFDYLWCYRLRPDLRVRLSRVTTVAASAGGAELLRVTKPQ
ncbi:MAG: hypothetical protein ACHQNE_00915 [Candidatus Kapaibacterium sp.]